MKVCFVAPYSYSLFDPSRHYPFGGLEVQAHMIATTLARRPGFKVGFVVFDHGQTPCQVIDGVTVQGYLPTRGHRQAIPTSFLSLSMLGRRSSVSKGRVVALKNRIQTRPLYSAIMFAQSIIDRLNALWISSRTLLDWLAYPHLWMNGLSAYYQHPNRVETYRVMDADIYVGFGASELMAELAAFCKAHNRKLVLFGVSDSDFADGYVPHSMERNYYGCRAGHCHYSLISADQIIVQNKTQQSKAWDNFGRESDIIVNPINLTAQPNPGNPHRNRETILWIGKADMVKRPLLVFDIARACPGLRFLMVVNPNRPEIEARLEKECPENVNMVPALSRADVPLTMERSLLLINTSRFEGFPNVFLEAFRAATPVVSLQVDPNHVIRDNKSGYCANGDMDRMIEAVTRLASDEVAWVEASRAARDYVDRTHDVDIIVDQIIDVLHRSSLVSSTSEPE